MEKSKKDKKKYTGFPGDCSQQQLAALDKFKAIVKSQNNGELDQRWDDSYLLRFLRARKFNLKETQKMWTDFINWRIRMQTYYFPELAALRKIYPHGYHKYDKKYRPLYIERLGFTQPEDIFKLTNEAALLKYYAMSYEILLTKIFDACTEQKLRETGDGTKVLQTCTILDLKDIKLSNASAAYRFAKPASEMAQNNYPQMLGNMFIINAPFLFTGVWAIVRMWIDDKTKQKIQILGKDYKKELLKHIQPENLPDFIDGGTCKCKGGDCLSINTGPWNPEGKEFFPHCLEKVQEHEIVKKKTGTKMQEKKEELKLASKEVKQEIPLEIQEKQAKKQQAVKEKEVMQQLGKLEIKPEQNAKSEGQTKTIKP